MQNELKHVLVYRKLKEKHLKYLEEHCKVSYYPNIIKENYSNFLRGLKTADGLFGAGMKVDDDLLQHARKLRVVSNFSAGFDNLDLKALTKRDVIATNVSDILTNTVADLIFTLLLSSARRTSELERFVRSKQWTGVIEEEHYGVDVHQQSIGIVGMGKIGRAVAKRAAMGFDMKVLYHKRTRDIEAEEDYGAVFYENLTDLLKESDFVCLTIALTKETRKLISYREFEQMKSTGILINGSRGAVVDETALIHALKKGQIRGAALDVFEQEPLDLDSELLELENLVLTPHIGSSTYKTRSLMIDQGIENLLVALKNQKPPNILNKEVFSRKLQEQNKL